MDLDFCGLRSRFGRSHSCKKFAFLFFLGLFGRPLRENFCCGFYAIWKWTEIGREANEDLCFLLELPAEFALMSNTLAVYLRLPVQ